MVTQGRGKRVALGLGIVAAGVIVIAAWVSWPWVRFWIQFEPLGRNFQGFPEYRHRQTGIVFVRLPGGTFNMGSPDQEEGRGNDEGPVHEVTLRPFLIAKHEVTQGQWKKVMGSNPSGCTGAEDCPVENVSFDDIQIFEAKTGLKLPTEAQWEYACRAGTTTPFAGNVEDLGWFFGNSGGTTHPVGTKTPNGFGLHDLQGNVWEWCEDVYDGEFFRKPEASGPDPVSTAGSVYRIFRGGSWRLVAWEGRSAYRRSGGPTFRDYVLGFRPALPSP